MEMSDEYNDEIYQLQDSGSPVEVFTDKAEAEKECMRRQIERMRGLEVGSYAYDLEDICKLSAEEVNAKLPFCNFPGDEDDFNCWTIPSDLTDEQMEKVCEVFGSLQFFTVVGV